MTRLKGWMIVIAFIVAAMVFVHTQEQIGPQQVLPTIQVSSVAVASLPTCNSAAEGTHAAVNNSNAASYTAGIGAVVAGGGTTHVPVYCDGTNWRIG